MDRARSIRFPCGVCSQKCHTDVIHCDACNTWFHSRCEQLLPDDMESMGESDLGYICARCCLGSDGGFDYEASLRHLSSSKISMRHLALAVKREYIFLRMHPFNFAGSKPDNATSQVDQNAVTTLNMCGGSMDGGRPLYVDGDGNCMFNALSVLLVGSQVLSVELRVRTCLELVNHGPAYKRVDSQDNLWKVSTRYDDECRDLCVIGKFTSTWSLQAASTVVQRQITSVYPVMNGIRDDTPRILNRAFIPRGVKCIDTPMVVMWSRLGPPRRAGYPTTLYLSCGQRRL